MAHVVLKVRPAAWLLALALVCTAAVTRLDAQGGKRSDAYVKVAAKAEKPGADGKQVITVTLTIDKEWHIYANPVGNDDLAEAQTTISVAGKSKDAVKIEYPPGKVVKDDKVGDYRVYEDKVTIKATVSRARDEAGPLEVSARFTACTARRCLLPATVKVKVD